MAIAALLYPVLRTVRAASTNSILSVATVVGAGTRKSLKTRLDHEVLLLARAAERPVLGWGRWGRNRIF